MSGPYRKRREHLRADGDAGARSWLAQRRSPAGAFAGRLSRWLAVTTSIPDYVQHRDQMAHGALVAWASES
jgi:hypothetical protein